MRKVAVSVGLMTIAAFVLGYYVGGLGRVESPLPIEATRRQATEPLPAAPDPESVAPASRSAPDLPADAVAEAGKTAISIRAATPQFRESMERGAREAHESFFYLYGIPQGEAEAIVRGMAEGQIEQIQFLEALSKLEDKAPLGESTVSDTSRQEMDELIFAHEKKRDAMIRKQLGIYYDDFEKYMETREEHKVIARVWTGLNQPINSATRDELLQILVEEGLFDWQRRASGPVVAAPAGEPTRDEILEMQRQRLESKREKNERVKERARSYLGIEEFRLLAETLDRESARQEAQLRVMELSDQD